MTPEIGITATPVIDRQLGSNSTMFVVAMSKEWAGKYFQRLHALDLATGADTTAPQTITATYPGRGDNSSGGFVIFDPAQYKERPGLGDSNIVTVVDSPTQLVVRDSAPAAKTGARFIRLQITAPPPP